MCSALAVVWNCRKSFYSFFSCIAPRVGTEIELKILQHFLIVTNVEWAIICRRRNLNFKWNIFDYREKWNIVTRLSHFEFWISSRERPRRQKKKSIRGTKVDWPSSIKINRNFEIKQHFSLDECVLLCDLIWLARIYHLNFYTHFNFYFDWICQLTKKKHGEKISEGIKWRATTTFDDVFMFPFQFSICVFNLTYITHIIFYWFFPFRSSIIGERRQQWKSSNK